MSAILTVLLTLVAKFVPAVAANETLISDIITGLEQALPTITKEYQDVMPLVENIIAALRGTDGITQAQSDALDALEITIDAEFDAAAKDEGL